MNGVYVPDAEEMKEELKSNSSNTNNNNGSNNKALVSPTAGPITKPKLATIDKKFLERFQGVQDDFEEATRLLL